MPEPQLMATAPNQVWTWDITKLLGPAKCDERPPGGHRGGDAGEDRLVAGHREQDGRRGRGGRGGQRGLKSLRKGR
jgi:hypothetical protein